MSEILAAAGIRIRREVTGNQKTTCPKCSSGRRNKKEPCLSVEIGTDGVRWNCHHCGEHGGEWYDDKRFGAYGAKGIRQQADKPRHRTSFRRVYG